MKRVFVSHSERDAALAERLSQDLSALGFQVLAPKDFQAGASIQRTVRSEIARADAFIVLLTPAFLRSRWGARELEVAYSRQASHTRVIPVIGADLETAEIPPLLQSLAHVDLTRDYKAGVEAIAKSIRSSGESDEAEDFTPVHSRRRRLFELSISLAAAAAATIKSAASVMDIPEVAIPAISVVAALALLTWILSWAIARRSQAPIQVVKRNVAAAFVNALDDSELNPLRTEASHAEPR